MTSYFHDDRGRLTRTEHPDLAHEDSLYNDAGRLTKSKDPRGFETTFVYDASGRLTKTLDAQVPPGAVVSAYDARGRLIQVTDPNNHLRTFLFVDEFQDTDHHPPWIGDHQKAGAPHLPAA